MKPILFPANTTNFTTNGIGHLSDAISCNVRETINGSYELEMLYPVEGVHFKEIQEGCIIYSAHDETGNPQPFEIYRISRPINRKVTVNASHISYRLNKIVVRPFVASGLQTVLLKFSSETISVSNPFTFTSDKTDVKRLEVKVPTAIRSIMGGTEGSIIDTYGGEWEYDHFSCILRNRRGQDSGVNIRYGKNLTSIKKITDTTNLWTGIVPYWSGTDSESTEEIVVYYDGVIYSPLHDTYPYDIVVAKDASADFKEPPTTQQLLTWGQNYVSNNAKSGIPMSVKISFVQLWQTEEYKDIAPLQRLRIGDTVSIFYEELGVDNMARISGYDYNVLLERYDSMTVGDVVASLAASVSKDIKDSTKDLPTKTFFELAMERATQLITGGLGGYVVINQDEDGHPNEILVMNTPDKDTATRVMRINYEGIAFGTGYNGPFNSAWTTLDGTFNAQNINVINLTAASITTGILKDQRNTNFWNMDTGEFQLAATATVGGETVSDIAENAASGAVEAQTQLSIFNKLTNNGQTQGIYLQDRKLYINGTYIQSGAITIKKGNKTTFYADTNTGTVNIVADSFSLSSGDTIEDIAEDAADDAVNLFDNGLTQQKVFNRLTNNGQTQGIYLENGKLYLNATYMQSGAITIKKGNKTTFYADTSTGTVNIVADSFSLSNGETIDDIAEDAASSAITTFDSGLTQQKVFNKLTNNGQTQGIYLQNGKLYLNASYMQSGAITIKKGTKTTFYADASTGTVNIVADSFSLSNGDTIEDIAEDAANSLITTFDTGLNQQKIFNKLTNNGQTQGIYLQNSKLYLNATYMQIGKISSANGRVYFDLDNNQLVCSRVVSASDTTNTTKLDIETVSYEVASGSGASIYTISGNKLVFIPGTSTYGAASKHQVVAPYGIAIYGKSMGSSFTDTPPALFLGIPAGTTSGSGNEFWLLDGYNACSVRSSSRTLYLEGSYLSISGGTTCYGNFTVPSQYTKSKLADTENYGSRLLYCYEMPSPMFGDIGEGKTDASGLCYVEIDDIFSETVCKNIEYQVFLQKEGQGDIWVDEKTAYYFVVRGTANLKFSWELKAKQNGFEQTRLEQPVIINQMDEEVQTPEGVLAEELERYFKEQEEALYETA